RHTTYLSLLLAQSRFFLFVLILSFLFLFFFHDPATTEIYTLSLHDALPILDDITTEKLDLGAGVLALPPGPGLGVALDEVKLARSEEHTSELQSRFDLVCRLLLEKKKKKNNK